MAHSTTDFQQRPPVVQYTFPSSGHPPKFAASALLGTLVALVLAASAVGCSASGHRPSSPQEPQPSAATSAPLRFDVLLSAAFAEFAKSGSAYAQLHHRYLGVTQPPPDSSTCPTWPDLEFGHRTLRLGFVPGDALHTVDASGPPDRFGAALRTEPVLPTNEHYTT